MIRLSIHKTFVRAAAISIALALPSVAWTQPEGASVAARISAEQIQTFFHSPELPAARFSLEMQLGAEKEMLEFEPAEIRSKDYASEVDTDKGRIPEKPQIAFFRAAFKKSAEPGFLRLSMMRSQDRSNPAVSGLGQVGAHFYVLYTAQDKPEEILASELSAETLKKLAAGLGKTKMLDLPQDSEKAATKDKMTYFKLATDSDFETTRQAADRGYSANTEILASLNIAQMLFELVYRISFEVSYQHSWNIPSVPYRDPNLPSTLKRFFAYWDRWFRPHRSYDAAILLLGGPTAQIGFSYSSSVCTAASYGVLSSDSDPAYRPFLLVEQLGQILGLDNGEEPAACAQTPESVRFIRRAAPVAAALLVVVVLVAAVYQLVKIKKARTREALHSLLEKQQESAEETTVEDDFFGRRKQEIKKEQPGVQEKLGQAGYFGEAAVKKFKRIRLLAGLGLPSLGFLASAAVLPPNAVGMLCFILFAIGYLLPLRWLDKAVARQHDEIKFMLPSFVEQMRICITGSLDVWSSMEECVKLAEMRLSPNAITGVLLRAKVLMQVGVPTEDALKKVAKETGVMELEHIFGFFAQVAQHGGEITKQMEALSDSALQNHHLSVEGKIASLAVAATFPLMLVFAGFFGILLSGMAAHFSTSINF